MSTKTDLYQVDAKGNIRVWSIAIDGNQLHMEYGLERGAKSVKRETIKIGLGGRTRDEQIKSRYNSRINNQLKRGYKFSREEALNSPGTNAMGLHKPMLAQPLKKVKNLDFRSAFLQPKFDGHRCLITKQGGELKAYSRNGKPIESVDHILENLHLREDQTIDGELYCHGIPLQKLTSWIKRAQEASRNLSFVAYDVVSPRPYTDRFNELNEMFALSPENIYLAPTHKVDSMEEVFKHFNKHRTMGYEGSIVRWGDTGYEVGKRSRSLVKVKEFQDKEFLVLDIIPSKDNWGILVCSCGRKTFSVAAPGTIEEKAFILENKNRYIGKHVTVEFANYTADSLPFHPVALRFREDV